MLKLTMIWCDHSNETSKVVLSQGTICILAFYEMNYELFVLTFAGAPSLMISQSAITDIQRSVIFFALWIWSLKSASHGILKIKIQINSLFSERIKL